MLFITQANYIVYPLCVAVILVSLVSVLLAHAFRFYCDQTLLWGELKAGLQGIVQRVSENSADILKFLCVADILVSLVSVLLVAYMSRSEQTAREAQRLALQFAYYEEKLKATATIMG